MKPLFTLMLTFLISVSLMGQQDLKEIKMQHHRKYSQGFRSMSHKLSDGTEHGPRYLSSPDMQSKGSLLKSASAEKQKMDSVLYEEFDLDLFAYVLVEKELYYFDALGYITQMIGYELDTASKQMLPSWKEDLSYDGNGNITVYLDAEWDKIGGIWVNTEKWEDEYDGNGNLTRDTYFEWDESGSQWVESVKYELTYDGQGNLISEIASYWSIVGSQWIPWWKDEYTYTDGKLMTYLELIWDENSSQWGNWYITESTYDGNGNLASELTREWDNNAWVNYEKYEYAYDGQGRLIEEVDSYWTDQWITEWKYLYTFDTDGNTTEELDQYWDVDTWTNDWKGIWTYDMNYFWNDLLVPYWFSTFDEGIFFVHMPVVMTEYAYFQENWYDYYITTAYYSAFQPTGYAEIHEGEAILYPNPATDHLTITWKESQPSLHFEVMDMSGRSVLSHMVDKNTTISIAELSSGLYLYRLSDNEGIIYTGKISRK